MFMLRKKNDEEMYRVYIADSLYYISHNLAFSKKYSELINPKPERSGEEIINDFMSRYETACAEEKKEISEKGGCE